MRPADNFPYVKLTAGADNVRYVAGATLARRASWHLWYWRAARAERAADLDYRRNPTPARLARFLRAAEHRRRVEAERPADG